MTDAVAEPNGFVYEPVRGPKRKVESEPRSDGSFERVEAIRTGCQWRVTERRGT
ncbi:hypothetical protein NDI85_11680 [Halomicroarcula sp. S1AR25-4]|nr:hypothetical protein [Halomicroarcula pellucida]MDS0278458.1 hypothetical protein [Halomicroarcula sp. S1AR25-4]